MYLDDLDDEDYEIAIKVVIVGNGAVGKSSMIQRYCKGIFTRNYKKTIGVDFLEKHITASGEDVRLMLWDTAGQEEFDAITKAYYRGAQACVVAFSTVDKASFEAVKKWKRKVEDECGHIPMVLVQNKIDLLHEAEVDSYEVEKFARNTGLKLFRTSVKENLNVSKVFHYLAERHIESVSRWSDESADDPVIQIGGSSNGNKSGQNHHRVRFSSSTENLSVEETTKEKNHQNNNNSYYHLHRHHHLHNHHHMAMGIGGHPNQHRFIQQQQNGFFLGHPGGGLPPFNPAAGQPQSGQNGGRNGRRPRGLFSFRRKVKKSHRDPSDSPPIHLHAHMHHQNPNGSIFLHHHTNSFGFNNGAGNSFGSGSSSNSSPSPTSSNSSGNGFSSTRPLCRVL